MRSGISPGPLGVDLQKGRGRGVKGVIRARWWSAELSGGQSSLLCSCWPAIKRSPIGVRSAIGATLIELGVELFVKAAHPGAPASSQG